MAGLDIIKIGQTAAKIGMTLAGNAKKPVTLKIVNPAREYDPTTDTMVGAPTEIQVEAIPYNRKNPQTPNKDVSDKQFSTHTRTLAIEAAKLPANSRISEEDALTFDGFTWEIVDAQLDPAEALWLVDIRR